MKTVSTLGRSVLYAVACLSVLCLPLAAHASNIGAGNLQFSIDNQTVQNGYFYNPTVEYRTPSIVPHLTRAITPTEP